MCEAVWWGHEEVQSSVYIYIWHKSLPKDKPKNFAEVSNVYQAAAFWNEGMYDRKLPVVKNRIEDIATPA